MSTDGFVALTCRGLISVSGPDCFNFLQNIISNDMTLLENTGVLHACLLTPQGKFLHDFYISHSPENTSTYLIDCEGGPRAHDLVSRLSLYKLRAQVTVTLLSDHHTTYITMPFSSRTRCFDRPSGDEHSFDTWDYWRILNGMPDGSRDAEIEISTLAELNLDQYAVSYTKGCYIGQELVARMHNRNLGKKKLYTIMFNNTPPKSGETIIVKKEIIGDMRSSCGKLGLVLLRHDIAASLPKTADGLISLF